MDTRSGLDLDSDAQPATAVETKRQARRRLLRKSLGAAPVLASISSGPAIAGVVVKTASAKCSASTSAPSRGEVTCNGKSHYKWCSDAVNTTTNDGNQSACKASGHGWPIAPTTKHYGATRPQVWSTCTEAWSTSADHYQVMNRYCARNNTAVDLYWKNKEAVGSSGRSQNFNVLKLAAHCSAALLSCEAVLIPPQICDATKIRQIWEAFKTGSGSWTPPGATCTPWTLTDACNWLNSMCTA